MWSVCHMSVTQNELNKCVLRWNKNYLMQGPHRVMTEICSSRGMEETPFQPPFQHVHVQTDGTSQASHTHWDVPFPPSDSLCFFFFFPDMQPSSLFFTLHYFFPSLPDLCLHAVLSRWAPASMIPAVCSRWKNNGWKTYKQGGVTMD